MTDVETTALSVFAAELRCRRQRMGWSQVECTEKIAFSASLVGAVETLTWIKSSYSGGSGGNCVEAAALPDGGRAVRDSKDPHGPALAFTPAEWDSFVRGVKDGEPGLA